MKLSESQVAVLALATRKSFFNFRDAIHVGGNGKTLHALTTRGLLEKCTYPDGSNDWCITAAGRSVSDAEHQPQRER